MRMLLVSFLLLFSAVVVADVTLKNDESIEGKILDITSGYILMRLEDGRFQKFNRGDVKEFNIETFLATAVLKDGSRVRGRGEFDTLEVKTAYGMLRVPVGEIRGIVSERLRLRIFRERALESFKALVDLWKQCEESKKEDEADPAEEAMRRMMRLIGGRLVGGDPGIDFLDPSTSESHRNALKQLFRFVEDEVKKRIEETKSAEEREFWQKLREEALAVEPFAQEGGDLIITKKFDILGEAELKRLRLQTPYGLIDVPYDELLAISFGIRPSQTKVVEVKPSPNFNSTGLSVKAGDVVEVRTAGILNIGGMPVPASGGNIYGRNLKGVELKIGNKVTRIGEFKKFRASSDGEILLRFDLSAFRWVTPDEVGGSLKVIITVCGTGIPLPRLEKRKEQESRSDRIKKLLYGPEK